MVYEQTQDILLDPVIAGDDAELAAFGAAGLGHGFRPGRKGELDGAFFPAVGLFAGDVGGELLTGHLGKLLGFVNQLIARSAVGGDNTAKSANIANVANEGAGINIPDDGNFVAIQIELGGFGGTPIGRELREFADNERFDEGFRRFLVIEIGADVADVGIREANDLAGVAGIGENFLVTGEAGIENDFPAPARNRAGSTAVKNAAVFEGESGGSVLDFGQFVLPRSSSKCAVTWCWLP
jgi:hypothetical protein